MFLGEMKRKSTRSLEISYSTLFTNLFSDGREINDGRFLRISFSASMNARLICLPTSVRSINASCFAVSIVKVYSVVGRPFWGFSLFGEKLIKSIPSTKSCNLLLIQSANFFLLPNFPPLFLTVA